MMARGPQKVGTLGMHRTMLVLYIRVRVRGLQLELAQFLPCKPSTCNLHLGYVAARYAKNYLLTYSAAKAEKASLLSPRGGCWAGPHSSRCSTTGSSCLPEVLYPSLGSPSTTASMSCEVEVEQAHFAWTLVAC